MVVCSLCRSHVRPEPWLGWEWSSRSGRHLIAHGGQRIDWLAVSPKTLTVFCPRATHSLFRVAELMARAEIPKDILFAVKLVKNSVPQSERWCEGPSSQGMR